MAPTPHGEWLRDHWAERRLEVQLAAGGMSRRCHAPSHRKSPLMTCSSHPLAPYSRLSLLSRDLWHYRWPIAASSIGCIHRQGGNESEPRSDDIHGEYRRREDREGGRQWPIPVHCGCAQPTDAQPRCNKAAVDCCVDSCTGADPAPEEDATHDAMNCRRSQKLWHSVATRSSPKLRIRA